MRALLTLGPIGYCQGGGTLASLATLPLVLLFSSMASWWVCVSCIAFLAVGAFLVIKRVYAAMPSDGDPSEIVIDEVIGCLITFAGCKLTIARLLVGFCLFRFFDISKVGGIRFIERLPHAYGILLDDVVAGCFAHAVLYLLIHTHIVPL